MKKTILFVLLMALFACGASIKITSSWVNPEQKTATIQYKTLLIIAITSNPELKLALENQLEKDFKKIGLIGIKSSDKLGDLKGEKPTKAQVLEAVKNAGADAVFTAAVVDEVSKPRLEPGSTTVYAGGYYGYYGDSYSYGEQGHYSEDKTYFLESNFFDAQSEALIWTAQSDAYNPSSISQSVSKYSWLMINRLKRDKVL